MYSLITALEDAREFHQLEANLQVTQYITETKDSLMTMIRLAGAEDDILVQLQILSDFRCPKMSLVIQNCHFTCYPIKLWLAHC